MSFRFDDDNEFEEVDEEETDEESEDDEDESDEDDADEDESDDDDEADRLDRIEKAFRAERTVIRACDNVADLRAKRREYQVILANTANNVGRLRMNDLIELVDERAIELKAGRFAAGRP